jgi:hypothetical protein
MQRCLAGVRRCTAPHAVFCAAHHRVCFSRRRAPLTAWARQVPRRREPHHLRRPREERRDRAAVGPPPQPRRRHLRLVRCPLSRQPPLCGAMQKSRIERSDFGWEIAHAAVSRRPPISLSRIVARTHMYTYTARVWDLSIVQGPFSVALCRTFAVRLATFATLYLTSPPISRRIPPLPLPLLRFAS